jgi:hypothetical protein
MASSEELMKTCKVCGHEYRKGRIAFIMGKRGLKSARVCQGCADKGVVLVAASPIQACKCGKPATKCHVCAGIKAPLFIDGAVKVLEGRLKAVKTVRYTLNPAGDPFTEGKIEGLESAIELLKSGRF